MDPDIRALIDLREHLARLTENAERSRGWTYHEEIILLNRIIARLATH